MRFIRHSPLITLMTWVLSLCVSYSVQSSELSVPPGFHIEPFASVPNPRQMALTKSGRIIVGSRRNGNVHAVIPIQGMSPLVAEIADNLNMPAGVAIHPSGDLYIAATHEILRIQNIDQAIKTGKFPLERVTDKLPNHNHHGWKHIKFDLKGDLIIPVGAPCNVCLSATDKIGTLQRFNLKNKTLTTLAKGIRNSIGFDWHPVTGQLWFSDNGRDWMGDDLPPDEINVISKPKQHFGFPFIHGSKTKEPDQTIQKARPAKQTFTPPQIEIQAHSAPLGIHFYKGNQFPSKYKHALFVALHGSWNRSEPVGYKVMAYWFDKNNTKIKEEIVVKGFLTHQGDKLGRPVDFLELEDGSLLISDDKGDKIWRLTYTQ